LSGKEKQLSEVKQKLPSRFQIGDHVSRLGTEHVYEVTGVQFTEGKVHYLLDGGDTPVDSADVNPA
jgi:hypothetical protein